MNTFRFTRYCSTVPKMSEIIILLSSAAYENFALFLMLAHSWCCQLFFFLRCYCEVEHIFMGLMAIKYHCCEVLI